MTTSFVSMRPSSFKRSYSRILAAGVVILCFSSYDLLGATFIKSISIPVDSQGTDCRPAYDDVWSVSGDFDENIGIGIIVKPTWTASNVQADFALHLNDHNYSLPPDYVAFHVPDPVANTITYTFNKPVIVTGVRIAQHVVGISKVNGRLGNPVNSLTELGDVFGPAGDVTLAPPFTSTDELVAFEGETQDFLFGNTIIAGDTFTLTITKTFFYDAYANHRIFGDILNLVEIERVAPAVVRTTKTNK